MNVPRLVVAAPGSGHGKTTVATGLMAALRARGLTVSGHKAGPDYIDPGYHALATGRPGRNLDPVLCGEDLIAPLFAHGAAGAGIAVVEGVMGLFDGRGPTPEGSTAHVARLLGAPVLLVVDASAQGRSVAALVSGFVGFDPAVRVAGVILNRVGSDRHEQILRAALAAIGTPVLGALRRDDAIAAPSRHLGLVPVAEREPAARQAIGRLAAAVSGAVDLDAIIALARTAGPLTAAPWDPSDAMRAAPADPGDRPAAWQRPPGAWQRPPGAWQRPPGAWQRPASRAGTSRPVIAVAGGAAFSFHYPEHAELLAAAGAEVVIVDPLRDETLPPGTSGLVLGGGFPEVHAGELSANERLRAQVPRLAAAGAPVAAECAGLLYLARELDGLPMCGVLDVTARMTGRLTLGYRDATAAAGSVLAPAGLTVRGHEFHRTAVAPAHSPVPAWMVRGRAIGGRAEGPGGRGEGLDGRGEGHVQGQVHASYLHLHWAGYPQLAARVVAAAARQRSLQAVSAGAGAPR